MTDQHEGIPFWFGDKTWCPATDEGTQVDTPVDQNCLFCEEPIKEDDRGYMRPFGVGQSVGLIPAHRECDFRSIMGGVNHMRGLCSCQGGTEPPDPPEMTTREASQAAWDYYTSGTRFLSEISPP